MIAYDSGLVMDNSSQAVPWLRRQHGTAEDFRRQAGTAL
jgi:hypothetical protein